MFALFAEGVRESDVEEYIVCSSDYQKVLDFTTSYFDIDPEWNQDDDSIVVKSKTTIIIDRNKLAYPYNFVKGDYYYIRIVELHELK